MTRSRTRSAVLVTVLAVLQVLIPATSTAGSTFTFHGSAYGHGLGMAQYGALGLALRGWGHRRILRYYYRGTAVDEATSLPRRIRVGLVQNARRVRLTAENGRVELRVGDPATGRLVGRVPSGSTWTVRTSSSGRHRVFGADGTLVGGHAWGGPAGILYARYQPWGARVRVQETGHGYARGVMQLDTYRRCESCAYRLRLVLPLRRPAYLFGIAEVPSSWPMRALRAQAVAALTYALHKVENVGVQDACDCHVYASVRDQVYAGWDKEGGELGDRWVRAVRDIGRQAVLLDGRPILALYHSSSGGHTADNRDVFGADLPYLRGRCDIGDYTASNPHSAWTVSMSSAEVTARLAHHTGDIGEVTRFSNAVRDESGRLAELTVRGTEGSSTLAGAELRAALRPGLGLRSVRVWVNANRQVTGAIRRKYDRLRCRPGLPRSRQISVAGGLRQRFETGRIFHHDDTGAHWLHGAVLGAYLDRRGPAGRLGFPLTDVRTRSTGSTTAAFEHGRITCNVAGVCSVA